MLPQGDMPRQTTCHAGCGRTVEYKFSPRVCCSPCRLERKRARARRTAEAKRRQRGVNPVKGTVAACDRCGAPYTKQTIRGRYCPPCGSEVPRERARMVSRLRTATGEGREYQRQWQRKARLDPRRSVSAHMRTLMHRGLNGGKAGRSWREFVPYSLADLMAHLERQFLPGMTWANRGQWHIDHIVPVSSFEFTTPDCPGFKAAWALTNLRPLWATDNVRKSAKRTHLI